MGLSIHPGDIFDLDSDESFLGWYEVIHRQTFLEEKT